MKRVLTLALLLTGMAQSGPNPTEMLAVLRPAPDGCYLQIIPDYVFGVIYRPVLRPSPDCPADVSLRVRKTSTLNRKRDGASYQPIIPDGSERYGGVYSWTLGRYGSTIPGSALWTLYSWRWQYEVEAGSNVWRNGWQP